MERFWSKVDKSSDCWEWTAYRQPAGYGLFRYDGSMKLAHRVSWELSGRVLIEGLELDHLCSNRGCVNPEHLDQVDHRSNVLRSPISLAGREIRKLACPKGHLFTPKNTVRWASDKGKRRCRTCLEERGKL